MTDIEFALLIFGLIIATLVTIILVCIFIFKHKKKRTKILTENEFNEKLSNNNKMIEAEIELNKREDDSKK